MKALFWLAALALAAWAAITEGVGVALGLVALAVFLAPFLSRR